MARKKKRSVGKKSRPSTSARSDHESFSGPGFTIERRGNQMVTVMDRSADQQRDLESAMRASIEPLTAEIQDLVARLEESLSQYETFDVLAAVMLRNSLNDPETYKEYSDRGRSYVAEFVALLAAKRPYNRVSKAFLRLEAVEELQQGAQEVFDKHLWLTVAEDASEARADVSIAMRELQFAARMNELAVRNPAYERHLYQVLRGLFAPFDADLLRLRGYTVEDAIMLAHAIPVMASERFQQRVEEAQHQIRELEKEVKAARKRSFSSDASPKHREFVAMLASKSSREVRRALSVMMWEWLLTLSGQACSFSLDELIAKTGIPAGRLSPLLDDLTLQFGSVGSDFARPQPTHPLKERPLLSHESRWLAPAPMLLDWAIQPLLEGNLKGAGGTLWNRYQSGRHDFLVRKTSELLRRMMPDADLGSNLFYAPAPTGPVTEAELDIYCRHDSVLFLVEAKGRELTPPARRGAEERLKRDLRELVGESHRQALRAQEYVRANPLATFDERAARTLHQVSSADLSATFLISVTLASVGHLTGLLSVNPEIGREFFRAGEYSWIVSIYDLMVVAETIETPSQFAHYLKRRSLAAKQGILTSHDELDTFGHYLAAGLLWHLPDNGAPTRINLLTHTTVFDDYYFYTEGIRRTPADKPHQRMDPDFRRLVHAVDSCGLPGRADVVMALLDLSSEARRALMRYVAKCRSIFKRERRLIDGSLYGEGDGRWAITVMFAADETELERMLTRFAERKTTEMGLSLWCGIGILGGRTEKVVKLVVRRRPKQDRGSEADQR